MLKREWGAQSNGNLQNLFISKKTATLVSEFAVENFMGGSPGDASEEPVT